MMKVSRSELRGGFREMPLKSSPFELRGFRSKTESKSKLSHKCRSNIRCNHKSRTKSRIPTSDSRDKRPHY